MELLEIISDTITDNPYYYGFLFLLLLLLIILLINQNNKWHRKKREEQGEPWEAYEPVSSRRKVTSVPKYAAGDEMDSLRHQRPYHEPETGIPPICIVAVILLVLLGPRILQGQGNPDADETPYQPPVQQTIYQPQIQQSTEGTNANNDIETSMDYTVNEDLTQLTITSQYTNKRNIPVYDIRTQYNLYNGNNEIIQRETGEAIAVLLPGQTIEKQKTITLAYNITNYSRYGQYIVYHKTQ